MERHYPHLSSPIRIGNVTFKNRIAAAPMGSEPNTSGFLSEQNLAAYELRAKGGAAVVTRGETLIGHRTDSAHGNLCNLGDVRFMPSHLQLTDVIHQHNALANIEILHCGARAHPRYTGGVIWGPSYQARGVYGVEVLEMTEDMMEEVADAFAHAAFVAKFGGFDMVMIHGAHGWLLSQFLSPAYNHRKDKYGGSMENRARFPLMVIDRVRKQVGPDFPIEYRMSGDELMEGGYGLDEALEFARMIDGKVDLIHVSACSFLDVNSGCRMFPSAFLPYAPNAYLAAAIKKVVKTPVATVGGHSDPAKMEALIADGQADIVVVGRQLLADPGFPNKVLEGRFNDVRPCTRCNHCLSLDFVPYVPFPSGISQCVVNPVIGRELRESYYKPDPPKKKVLVVGGGPGGMQAALSAAGVGHRVVLCEKSDRLGGLLASTTKNVPFKTDLRRFMEYLIRSVNEEPNIEVRLCTEVTPEMVSEFSPDTLVCCVGAEPILPGIEGIELPHVVHVTSLHDEGISLGSKIVVIGGGMAGCEDGLALAMKGKHVTILEMKDSVAKDAPVLHFKAMMLEFEKLRDNLKVLTNSTCTRITQEGVAYVDGEGREGFAPGDTVVIAAGMRTPYEKVDALRNTGIGNFIAVGDCLKPGKVLEAVHGGYFAGKNA